MSWSPFAARVQSRGGLQAGKPDRLDAVGSGDVYSRRAIVRTATLLLAATATPAFACVTISTEFTAAHHHFFKAAKKGDLAAMQSILQSDAFKLSDTVDWKTWPQWAIFWDRPKVLVSLLKVGAKPDQPDDDGGNAVLDVAGHKNPKWLKILLANGASPDARHAHNGSTPLYKALIASRDEQFNMLIQAKADLTSTDRVGNTPLHVAGQINKPWHALELLQAGADPLARNAQGQTFQRYVFMPDDRMATRTVRKGRQAVLDYLWFKEIPVEPGAPPRDNEGIEFRKR